MASLDDILTVQKNGVIAINNLNKTLKSVIANTSPEYTSSTISPSTTELIYRGKGNLYSISIPIFSGSGKVYIHDSDTTVGVSNANMIFSSLSASATNFANYQDIKFQFSRGIVLVTDANIYACVTYSIDIE